MKKRMNLFTKMFFVMTLCLFMAGRLVANNVTIANVSLIGDTVKFDLSWDNSWRNDGTANSTMNWDGAWVFIKYRDACEKSGPYPASYTHMWLVNDTAQQFTPAAAREMMGVTNIAGTDRAMGVFIFRRGQNPTASTFTMTNIKLRWDQVAQGTTGGNWDIRVNAIEMVYVPQGAFRLGGGNYSINSAYTYNFSNNSNGLSPYQITAENVTIPINNTGGIYTYPTYTSTGTIPADFPKGFNSFWVMKYEVSQQQYCDFLNSLDRYHGVYYTQLGQNSSDANFNTSNMTSTSFTSYGSYKYVMIPSGSVTSRQAICATNSVVSGQPWTFSCDANNNNAMNEASDGMNTACNYLYGGPTQAFFLKAYLDWAGIRPITEFEYEKTCRGPIANVGYQTNESVWGTDLVSGTKTYPTSITNQYANNEIVAPGPPSNGNVVANSGTAGPVRVGQYYQAATTRVQAGSSYYGCADMAGNVYEMVWSYGNNNVVGNTVTGTWLGRSFTNANYGDGDVQNAAIPTTWTNGSTFFYRGGHWATTSSAYQELAISWRNAAQYSTTSYVGGRGGRTAAY
jgi:hypothetical protein